MGVGVWPKCFLFWTLASCAAKSNDSGESRDQQCERMRNQVVEMTIAGIPTDIHPTPEDLARVGVPLSSRNLPSVKPDVSGHRAALRQALGHEYIESCLANLTPKQLECSLAAKDTSALVVCQRSTPSKEQP